MTQIQISKEGINWKPGLGQSFLRRLLRDLQLGSPKAFNVSCMAPHASGGRTENAEPVFTEEYWSELCV